MGKRFSRIAIFGAALAAPAAMLADGKPNDAQVGAFAMNSRHRYVNARFRYRAEPVEQLVVLAPAESEEGQATKPPVKRRDPMVPLKKKPRAPRPSAQSASEN